MGPPRIRVCGCGCGCGQQASCGTAIAGTEVATATQEPIPGLLKLARDEGKRDVFSGKRVYARYNTGVSTRLTTDPTNPKNAWSVVTHNVSGGGVGLWSREPLEVGTAIHVQDVTGGGDSEWLPGHVQHCSVGIRGYLIGIAFDFPAPPEETQADSLGQPGASVRKSGSTDAAVLRGAPSSAEWRYISCGAIGAIVGYVVSHNLIGVTYDLEHLLTIGGSGMLIGGIVGFLFARFFARRDAAQLRLLRQMIRDVSTGRSMRRHDIKAPTPQIAALHESLCDLGNRLALREEDERLQRQKLEEITQVKSNILAIVSHDMRTPLTSILLYAQMLLDEADTLDAEERNNFLDIIHSECTRLSRLVDDLLEVQRFESDRVSWDMKTHDLTATVRSCVSVFEAMAAAKNIELRVDCQENLPPIEADADKLSQVLSNLLSNALKYTAENGTVAVSASLERNDLILRVADSGPGIARDQWDQIFDRFTQIRDPNTSDIAGVGLGLYIVRKIIEGHGGCVWVNSEVGLGTEFVASIPRERFEPTRRMLPSALAGKKVVICDPDPELAATVSMLLRKEGLDVRTAHSGERLMAHIDHGDVDLVITDVLLPDVSVSELLDSLACDSPKDFRVIVHSYDGDGQVFSDKGVDVFLRRPVGKQDLIDAVQTALRKRSIEGCNIVTLPHDGLDTERMNGFFAARGHKPLIAETFEEVAALIRDYAIDIVVVPESLLDTDWDQLDKEPFNNHYDTRILVLCGNVRKRQQELAGSLGVTALTYRRGQEHATARMILAPQPAQGTEPRE